jgi:hypothetical protein
VGFFPTLGLMQSWLQKLGSLDPRFGTDRFARCTAQFDGFSMMFYCGTQMALRQHMIFRGTKD